MPILILENSNCAINKQPLFILPNKKEAFYYYFVNYTQWLNCKVEYGHFFPAFEILGFLPKETAKHHRDCVLDILQKALDEASLKPKDIDVVCYTKGIIHTPFTYIC